MSLPATVKRPAPCGVTTTISAGAGMTPVSAEMVAPWETSTTLLPVCRSPTSARI